MRIRIPLIIEESLIKQIDEIAGEKTRRAATIEAALREYIAKQARKAKAAPVVAEPVVKAAPVRGTAASAAKSAARTNAAPAAKTVARAKR
jgi:metal-responsive CopG/Arc/MetJ family transcriptional regulator